MEKVYKYFNRDISWLSFNYRVLLESENNSLPIYERIKYLSIHASNLEEFYKIRVAEHRSVIMKKIHADEDTNESEQTLSEINAEVTRQQQEFFRIFNEKILPELEKNNIVLYKNCHINTYHEPFVKNYFNEEIFPFLEPVMILKDDIRFFIRDNRLYLVVRLIKKGDEGIYSYAIIKIPYSKVPRFIELPEYRDKHYFIFIEDIIKFNLQSVFPGFVITGCHSVKISRDADIYIDEELIQENNLVETIIKKVKKRKLGDLSRFVYDRSIPLDFLRYICEAFNIRCEDLVPDNPHLCMEDLVKFPNPYGEKLTRQTPKPIRIPLLENGGGILRIMHNQDIFLHYPYHTFDYFIRFLTEAAFNPRINEIKITQYRVASNSEVINALINAARHGKKVTVFVEIKARFDEENNMHTSEIMKQAGIRIIYSIPRLKVHAKIALVTEKPNHNGKVSKSYTYLSTGNFNEKTAKLYSDMALLTCNKKLTQEINHVFDVLEEKNDEIKFKYLLVAQFNMIPMLKSMIKREIRHVKQGKKGRIILKMNALQDHIMIDELYKASEAGVEIDLIVRGICCLVPNQPYSKNIRVTRIVDMYLEHSRVWYFYNNGSEDIYLTSADWMKRNLYRRIETAFPILDNKIKQSIIHILNIQLQDNVKACLIDENLQNVFKTNKNAPQIWAQQDTYNYLLKS